MVLEQYSELTAYFDESIRGDCITIGGVLIYERSMPHFNREWTLMLERFQIPAVHMTDVAHMKLAFKGWPEVRRRELMRNIKGIIERRIAYTVALTLPIKKLKLILHEHEAFRQIYQNEYCAAASFAILLCSKKARTAGRSKPIDYVFDRGNSQRSGLDYTVIQARKSVDLQAEHRLGNIVFGDDRQVFPLQLADVIAYEARKAIELEVEGKMPRWLGGELLTKHPSLWAGISEERLERIAKMITALVDNPNNSLLSEF